MGKLRRLEKENVHLQGVLATKNKRIDELEAQIKKLTPKEEKKQ